MIDDILSPPTTITFLCFPVSINCAPVASAKIKPEQPPARSNPQAFLAPTLSQITFEVEGKEKSGA